MSSTVGLMHMGCYVECEVEGFFDEVGPFAKFGEPIGLVEFEPVHRELLSSEYFGLYSDFLQQPFAQPCAIGNAVDALIGPTGVLREAIERDHDHWDMAPYSLDEEAEYMKRYIAARFDNVQQIVEAKCESIDGGCATGAACLTIACPANTTCVLETVPSCQRR